MTSGPEDVITRFGSRLAKPKVEEHADHIAGAAGYVRIAGMDTTKVDQGNHFVI